MTRLVHVGLIALLVGAAMTMGEVGQGQTRSDSDHKPGTGGQIAWGTPVEGLQAGIRWATPGPEPRSGTNARFALFVRNVTDHTIDVAYYPVQERFGWTISTQNGIDVLIRPAKPTREYRDLPLGPAISLRFEPGKEVKVPGKEPQFAPGFQGSRVYTKPAAPGARGQRMTVQAQPLEPVAKGEEWLSKLLTGKLEFRVDPAPKAGSVSSSPAPSAAVRQSETGGANRQGWGAPVDGLQVGLIPLTTKRVFSPGDTFAFELRARNSGDKAIDYTLRVPDSASISLGPGNLVTVQSGYGQTVSFHLDPGEEKVLPRGTYLARIREPGGVEGFTRADQAQEAKLREKGFGAPIVMSPILRLLPGEYTLRCPMPVWMVDAADSNRATAHRAQPGTVKFRVSGFAARVARETSIVDGAHVTWGQDVDGLQGGIAITLRAESPDELPLTFFVRNVTSSPVSISYPALQEYDWSPRILDSSGKDRIARMTFVSGWRGMKDAIVPAGGALAIGQTRIRLLTKEPPRSDGPGDAGSWLPTLVAEPGRYSVSLSGSVRFGGTTGFDIILESGRIDFRVPGR